MRSFSIMLAAGLLIISTATQAKLPSAATAAIGHLIQSVLVFFGVVLLFAVVGALIARKAPRSRDVRQTIFSISTALGVLVAGFIAMRFLA